MACLGIWFRDTVGVAQGFGSLMQLCGKCNLKSLSEGACGVLWLQTEGTETSVVHRLLRTYRALL